MCCSLVRRIRLCMLFALLLAILVTAQVSSVPTTHHVGAGQTYATIQAAVTAAAAGDTILIHQGTYTENVDLNGKSLILTSENPDDGAVVAATVLASASAGVSALDLSDCDAATVLEGITLTMSLSYEYARSIDAAGFRGTIRKNVFRNINHGGADASIIDARPSGSTTPTPTISDNTFSNNTAYYGSGIKLTGANATVARNSFAGSVGSNGGSIHISGGTVALTSNTFTSGTAWNGGAVYVGGAATVTITDCTFDTNTATAEGGGIYSTGTSVNLALSNCHFTSCSGGMAYQGGGNLYANGGSHTIYDCTVDGGSARLGGALLIEKATSADIRRTVIESTSASVGGAGILTHTVEDVRIEDSEVRDCSGTEAVAVYYVDTSEIHRNTIEQNASPDNTALLVHSGATNITNNTVDDNTSTGGGSAVRLSLCSGTV